MNKVICRTLCIALLLFAVSGMAQEFRQELFHKGRVNLTDDRVISGMLKYDLDEEVVQVQNERLLVFPAHQVVNFSFTDQRTDRTYTFETLDFDRHGNDYEVPTFFEVLLTGQVNLLFRDRVVISTTRSYDMYGNPIFPQAYKRMQTYFYIQYPSGRIREFDKSKRGLQTLLADKWPEVKKFIKRERLKPSDDRDIPEIIEYYNSLFKFREGTSAQDK